MSWARLISPLFNCWGHGHAVEAWDTGWLGNGDTWGLWEVSDTCVLSNRINYPLLVLLCLQSLQQESRWLSWIRFLAFGHLKLNEHHAPCHQNNLNLKSPAQASVDASKMCCQSQHASDPHKSPHACKVMEYVSFASFLSKKVSVLWRNSRGKWCLLKASSGRVSELWKFTYVNHGTCFLSPYD